MTADRSESDPAAQTSPAQSSPAPLSSGWRVLLHRLAVDRATFLAVALRIWQLAAGAVSAVLIASFFPREVQGFHYTFGSLIALQAFFELGLAVVIVNVTSHEWAHLELDEAGRITGPDAVRSRLFSLGRQLLTWYGAASLLFMLLVGWGGDRFLSADGASIAWRGPWWCLTILSGLLLWTLPFNALLEGCNQVTAVQQMRMRQAVAGNLVTWVIVISGGGLWAGVGATVCRLAVELWFLLRRYGGFFDQFRGRVAGAPISWRHELWPLQWRLALQAVAGYFAFSIFSPVMFRYHGAVEAGRMGMTWTLIVALQAAAMAWVQTRSPRFGMLASRREYAQLDAEFRRVTLISTLMIAVGGLLVCGVVVAFQLTEFVLADRLLSIQPVAIFVIASLLFHIPHCLDLYIRAHKQDRMTLLNVCGSGLIGLGVWGLGSRFGPIGAAWSYLLSIGLVITPGYVLLYRQIQREHNSAASRSVSADGGDIRQT